MEPGFSNIRVTDATRKKIKILAAKLDVTFGEAVEKAIAVFERQVEDSGARKTSE